MEIHSMFMDKELILLKFHNTVYYGFNMIHTKLSMSFITELEKSLEICVDHKPPKYPKKILNKKSND
jgi:hypothetical protein